MKLHSIINLTCGTFVFLAASCSQDDVLLDSQTDEGNLQSYTLYLDAEAPSFEKVDEGETRASGSSWENGDVIYVTYSNGGSTVVSNATYNSSLGAFQFSSASLYDASEAACSVYYFRGGSYSVSGTTVTMDKHTAIFTDTKAKYTCSSNVVTMSAAFKPYTWRLCFKGTVGTQVKLEETSTILYCSSLNLSSGAFTKKRGSANLLVQADGYTPFVYGIFEVAGNALKVKVGGTYYTRTIYSSPNLHPGLLSGESGYFTVPTTGNHAFWSTSRDISGFEYVDLGLPSGTLWAKCNLGASSEEEYGDFFAWGEISGYNGLDRSFDWSTYEWCQGSSSSLTKYNNSDGLTTLQPSEDAATAQLGSGWRIPTREEWVELNNYTTKSNETINGIKGRRLKSTQNSNSIFLPFGGYFDGSSYVSAGSNANYWSSTLSSTKSKAYIAYTPNSGAIRTNGTLDRCLTEAIRPVYDQSSSNLINGHEYVDLGLPSGTLWATCNVGANSPEETGGYYAWGETEEKDYYWWETYTHCNGTEGSCHHIGDDIAGTDYDVAHVKWGGSWRMPSMYQIQELLNNCTRKWTTMNGVHGTLVTGPNGASIFLPATGYRWEDYLSTKDSEGYYWSSSLSSENEFHAVNFPFDSDSWALRSTVRLFGFNVRAVSSGEPSFDPECPVADPIDLGLPSGTKWASWNVGASAPEESGGFYAWGETKEKDYYWWQTYTHCDGARENCHHIDDDIAGTAYDVAHVKWGGSWRMPSSEQIQELVNNCTRKWTTKNGVHGTLVTGPNGASIFLPAAGYRWEDYLSSNDNEGYYWSSSITTENEDQAVNLPFDTSGWKWSISLRMFGLNVRAVCP